MEKPAYLLYLFALAFSPLAFGTIDLWALALVEGSLFLALAGLLSHHLRTGKPLIKVPALVPLLLFLAWTTLQIIPLPPALVALISPAAAALRAPLLAADPNAGTFIPLSLHPWYTLQDLFRFSAYAACYFLTVQLLHTPQRMRQTLALVLGLATCISLYAIIQHYIGNDRIFGFRTFTHQSVVGTFAYKNHFAAYIALLLPLALSLFLYYRPRHHSTLSLRQALLNLGERSTPNQHLPLALAGAMMVLALLLSGSRGGVGCAFLALLLLLIMGRKRFRLSGLLPLALGLTLLAATGVGRDGLLSVDQRFGTALTRDGASLNGRLEFWKNSLRIIGDFPLTGTGAGTFRAIYPRYQAEPNGALPLHTHNDYLETQSNGGLVASLLVLAFLALFFRTTFTSFGKRKDSYVIHLYLGSLAGLVALLLHCLIDLQFRISATIGLYFFLLLGIHAAAVALKQHPGSTRSLQVAPFTGPRAWAGLGGLSLFALSCFVFQINELRALALFPEIATVEPRQGKAGYEDRAALLALENFAVFTPLTNEQKLEVTDRATRALRLSPLNPRYPYIRSLCADPQTQIDQALADGRTALRLNPVQAVYNQHYGALLAQNGQNDRAAAFFQAATANDPTEPRFHRAYLSFLLRQGQTNAALRQVTAFLVIRPEQAPTLLADLQAAGLTPAEVAPALPRRVAPLLALAAWLEKIGDQANACQCYDQALDSLDNEKQPRAAMFAPVIRFYQQQKNEDKVLSVLQQAVDHLPREFGFRLQLGDLYSRRGLYPKALDEYQRAQQLQPANAKIQQRLDQTAALLNQ